jgi:hypothetical protein
MSRLTDSYSVYYNDKTVGYYSLFDDGKADYYPAYGNPEDIQKELKKLGLDKEITDSEPLKVFTELIKDEYRIKGRKKFIYEKPPLRIERQSQETGERYSVYRRNAEKGDADYSDLPHDAPHNEGPHTPEGMREWASWYAFNKMDDGTYEAELDEAWWWGGGHNDGGTIRKEIPEEWFALSYDEFLERVVTLAAAAHYGFTAEMLKEKEGLKDFFGFEDKK